MKLIAFSNQNTYLIPDEKIKLGCELARLKKEIFETRQKALQLEMEYSAIKKEYKKLDLERAEKDGRLKVLKPAGVPTSKSQSKQPSSMAKQLQSLSKSQLAELIAMAERELE